MKNFMKLFKNKYIKSFATYILGIISTLIVFWIQEEIRNSRESADISATPQGIVILNDSKNDWFLTLYLRVSNSGNSPCSIEYKNFKLKFPSISLRPYKFDFNRHIDLSGNTTIDDTLTIQFHSIFDKHDIEKGPLKFEKGSIDLLSPKSQLLAKAEFNSTDVDQYLTIISEHIDDPKELKGVREDTLNKQLKWPVKLCPITYHGKVYKNYIYPREVEVVYKIVNNRIKLRYNQSFNSQSGNFKSLTYPIQFFPDSSIINKIDYPKYWEMNLLKETRHKDYIEHKYFKFYIGNQKEFKKQFIYIF